MKRLNRSQRFLIFVFVIMPVGGGLLLAFHLVMFWILPDACTLFLWSAAALVFGVDTFFLAWFYPETLLRRHNRLKYLAGLDKDGRGYIWFSRLSVIFILLWSVLTFIVALGTATQEGLVK